MKDRFKFTVFILIMLVIVSGCQNTSQQQESNREEVTINQPSEPYLTFKDFDGETVTLQDKPQNIVILNEQVLYSFYQVGGKAVVFRLPLTLNRLKKR